MDYADATPISRERSLGEVLREARQERGLELSDIAESTHVRKEYLKALEEGRYQDLPEDIYARNFLKLYAKAVGLSDGKLLELYKAERQRAAGHHEAPVKPVKVVRAQAKPVAAAPVAAPPAKAAPQEPKAVTTRSRPVRRAPDVSGWLPIVLLIAVVVGITLWGFRSVFFTGTRPAPVATAPIPQPEAAAEPAPASPAVQADTAVAPTAETVRVSIISDPPGAEVAIDGIVLAGTTPLIDYPVTAAANRTLQLTLPGYETFETVADLSSDTSLNFSLSPVGAAADAEGVGEAAAPASPSVASEGQIAVTITATTWFEAFQSNQRNVGERLVYATLQPGASYVFDLPVYLHVGNAAGVLVSEDGGPGVPMGSSGEVVSRAFTTQ
jgi:cytoskeleton protein RodZ